MCSERKQNVLNESPRGWTFYLERLRVPQRTNHPVCETGAERMNARGGLSDDNTAATGVEPQIPLL